MAYDNEKPKAGMEGRTSQTERWGHREDVKKSAKKHRRLEGFKEISKALKEERYEE